MSFHLFRAGTIIALLAAVFVTAQANAQSVSGRFTGSVVDPSGNIVVGASITLTNDQTGDMRAGVTNTAGVFLRSDTQSRSFTISRPG